VTVAFFSKLRATSLSGVQLPKEEAHSARARPRQLRNYWDFTTLNNITGGAALILAAEFDRMLKLKGAVPTTVDLEKWSVEVYGTLSKLGFFRAMEFGDSQLLADAGKPQVLAHLDYIMPMVTGHGLKTDDFIEPLAELLDAGMSDEESRVALGGALIDAIENVKYHAYPNAQSGYEKVRNCWWLSGSVSKNDRRLTISLYDQGVSIPGSMTLSEVWKSTFEAFHRLSGKFIPDGQKYDAEALRWALSPETSTKLSHRGKGLPNIKEMVSNRPEGRLMILSRKGRYIFANGRDSFETMDMPLLGTYVEISATFPDSLKS
jgi:hypothetical protein